MRIKSIFPAKLFAGVLSSWLAVSTVLLPLATQAAVPLSERLILTEIQSNQASAGVNDYWELTNIGNTSVDLSNWKWDDDSRNPADPSAVTIPAGTTIAPGESIIFTAMTPTAFRTWWGLNNTVQVISTGAAPGLGQNDAIGLFTDAGTEVLFFSYAANGFARSNGTASLGGHAGASGGGSATAALILDPTRSTASGNRRYTAASVGTYGAFASASNAADIGSPGVAFTGPKSVDLSRYVRVGRYNLPEPTRTTPPDNISLLAQEASGVTYDWDTDTLFITADGGTSIVQVSKTGQLIDSMTLARGSSPQGTDFYDPEGITYVGNGKFVISEERDRQLVLFTYAAGTTLTRAQTKTVKLGTFVNNTGTEGLSYDPLTGGFICLKEIDPQGIFQTDVDFEAGTASNGSPTTVNSVNLFDPALMNLLDVADVFALSNLPSLAGQSQYGNILVLSQESAKVLNIDRAGNISSSLQIVSDPGNPLSVSAQQHEGLTMDRDGYLYIVSENGGGDVDHPQLWVYAPATGPNQAPTGITFNNPVTSLPENTSITASTKLADIIVADDGLGLNDISLTGADAAYFEVINGALYLKAGVSLDYETKTSYTVTVNVDDTTTGTSPDVSMTFTLNVSDVVNEAPPTPSLIISEVAPWSSGNSPLGMDWFEVTNPGTNAVDITGWKVDDSSASYAAALALNGITSIAPGESVIFIETADLATAAAAFKTLWFGANPPAGLQIGSYTGSGIGLSTGGDGINLYDVNGVVKASVSFGASPAGPSFATFDNAVGLNNATISRLSVVGLYDAFVAVNDANEIGSPGSAGKLIISEVAPWSSGTTLGADWFEVSNTGARPVDITGWKVDDNSESPNAAVALNGITTIGPGESVIFMETANLAAAAAAFKTLWFGANPPAGLQVGSYSGSGVGLGTGGDAVNLYDNGGRLRAKVVFGASPAGPSLPTFDNAIGLNGTTITQLSAAGRYGAFAAVNDANQIGSPGNTGKLVISEVAPWSSGNSPVAADWFEVSNMGTRTVDITGWKVDDSSAVFSAALALNGITNIAPGESVIFMETADLATTKAAFLNNWFGANPPAKLQIGNYTGSGIGLSTGGDAVNLYNSNGVLQASVTFGASSAGPTFATFDNSAVLDGTTISLLSVLGRYGAFVAANDLNEIGSPGTIKTVPLVALTAPLNNALVMVPGSFQAQASVSKFGGTITQVEFYLDGALQDTITTAPYVATINVSVNGAHTLSAVAVDNSGLRATNTVTVIGNDVPTVMLTSPTQIAYTAPASILLAASVTDADGTIASVKFYAGDTLLATVTTAPYQFSWNNVPVGSYFVTAKAEDNQGGIMTSVSKHVIVGPVGITAPVRLENGTFQFQFVGSLAGKSHRIEVSTDLIHWSSLGTVTPESNTVNINDSEANGSQLRFYRVVQEIP